MLHYHQIPLRLGALVAATVMALATNGSLLLGFDHLARQGDAALALAQTAVAAQRSDASAAL